MAPVMKSKPKDKSPKLLLKLSTAGGSGYNPHSGTFHSLEVLPPSVAPRGGGRRQTATLDEDASDYDCGSNESSSGESLDETSKDQQVVPGAADMDKREKNRLKNERKHQRQRQRRVEEVLAQCTAVLMSRKLDLLADQMVGMGFPVDQATRALIASGGHLEEAVVWLLEAHEEEGAAEGPCGSDDRPRINIDDEIAEMAKMETELKISKQEVYRAVVASEGDLKRATEILKAQKSEPLLSTAQPRQGLIRLPPSEVSVQRPQAKPLIPIPSIDQQQQRKQEIISGTKTVPTTKTHGVLPPGQRRLPTTGPSPLKPDVKVPTTAAIDPIKMKRSLPVTTKETVVIMQRPQSTSVAAAGSTLTVAALKAPGQNLHRQQATTSELLPLAAAPVNWTGGGRSMSTCDYNYVDWSLNSTASAWQPFPVGCPDTLRVQEGLQRPSPLIGATVEQQGGFPVELGEGLTEWTNAFAGRDLFSQSRKLVMSSP